MREICIVTCSCRRKYLLQQIYERHHLIQIHYARRVLGGERSLRSHVSVKCDYTGVVKPFESFDRVDSNPTPNHQDPS